MPPDHYPATVYRYTKTRGWERYRASTPQFARRRLLAAAGQRRQGGVSVSGEHEVQPSSQTVCAVPRRGCVEVRALRLRIRLFAEEDPNDDGGENGNSGNHPGGSTASDEGIASGGGGGGSRENTLVIRRSSRVLLSSRRNLGAIVLKFRSVGMAVDFCSRLMELNAPPADGGAALLPNSSLGGTIGGGSLMSDPMSLSGPPSFSVADMATTTVPASGFGAAPTPCTSTGQEEQLADMASYMVRLLHDPSFLSFVNSVENGLANSVAGGELMLKALAMSSDNAPTAPTAATAVAGAGFSGRADGGST